MLLICLKSLLNYDIPLHFGRCHEWIMHISLIPCVWKPEKYNYVMCWINITDTAWENKTTHLNTQLRCFEMQLYSPVLHVGMCTFHFILLSPRQERYHMPSDTKKGLWYCLVIVPCKNTLLYYHMDEATYYGMLQTMPWLPCICGWSG